MKVELRIKKPATLSSRAKSRHLRVCLTSSFIILTSYFSSAQVADIRLDKNGNVLNSSVNFPPGALKLNGVAFTGSGLASYVYRDLNTLSTDAINAALVGKTTSDEPLYSTRTNTGSGTYVRSTSSWAAPFDLTSSAVYTADGTVVGTLISPRHVLLAHHAHPSTGQEVRFVTSGNAVVSRTISGSTLQIGTTDIEIGKLSADVTTCSFAKVLTPAQEAALAGAAVLFTDQNQAAFVGDISAIPSTATGTITVSQSSDATRSTFWKLLVSGDSSHPCYAILDGQAILLGVAYTSGNGYPTIAQNAAAINAAMTSLGGGYQLTQYQSTVLRAGTSGTDVNVQGGAVNVPTASATVRGALASSDWSAFTAKVSGAANTGSGVGVFRDLSGTTARFKSIKAGSHIAVGDDGLGNITVDAALTGGSALNFTDLGDVPHSYSGVAGKSLAANDAGTGLTFSGKQPIFRPDLSHSSGDFTAVATTALATGTLVQFIDKDTDNGELATYILVDEVDIGAQADVQPSDGIQPSDYNATTNHRWWALLFRVETDGAINGLGSLTLAETGRFTGSPEGLLFNNLVVRGTGGAGWILLKNQSAAATGISGWAVLYSDANGRPAWKDSGDVPHLLATTALSTVTYSTSMTPDAFSGSRFVITATNSTAFTINAPTNPATSLAITFTIRNTSGGALGTATWNAVFKMSSWTQPANGFSRSITFNYNGTNWIETSRTPADVPN